MNRRRNLNIRSICFCCLVAFFILLSIPRIIIWPSVETTALVLFYCFLVLLIAWTCAYHDAKEQDVDNAD